MAKNPVNAGARKPAKKALDYRLAVDVGNTQTVMGLFDGAVILKRWRLATRKDITVDEIALWLRGLVVPAVALSLGNEGVRTVLASVVPAQDGPWIAALREVFALEPRVLDYR